MSYYFLVARTGAAGCYAFSLSPDFAAEYYSEHIDAWSVWREVNGGAIKVAECPTREAAEAAQRLLRGPR